jgi:hypothetical protein
LLSAGSSVQMAREFIIQRCTAVSHLSVSKWVYGGVGGFAFHQVFFRDVSSSGCQSLIGLLGLLGLLGFLEEHFTFIILTCLIYLISDLARPKGEL